MVSRSISHYRIIKKLGAGGMGEVYQAQDARLERYVAIKVLPASFANDADRLSRFEQEARATSALNHPNILTVHDIGTHEGTPYIVAELLEGEELREQLNQGALPVRRCLNYAQQIAAGLAAAHERGIVHRDLKPENLFVTKDGRVKILDFGLAKLKPAKLRDDGSSEVVTAKALTDPGTVMGTAGYMSPEQVRGQAVDHRSDIFALGAILYEMLSGKRAFEGESGVETMSAILREDPAPLSQTNQNFNPALEHVVRHCLEKSPDERFQSARDLAFDLEMLSGASGSSAILAGRTYAPPAKQRLWQVIAAISLLATLVLAALIIISNTGGRSLPSYTQLTFRRGTVLSARFSPDEHTIVYSASWNGNSWNIFSMRSESTESRSLEMPNSQVLAISSSGEMAVLLNRQFDVERHGRGTLARMPLQGGAPREVLEDVEQADWSPDGTKLAVVHYVEGHNRLEYPIGKVLHETPGWISHLRVSPKGDMIAFLDHQIQEDDRGWVAVMDLTGNKKTLSGEWGSGDGLAWSPNGEEIWFTATKRGEANALYAVTLSGQERIVARVPASLLLHDISRSGRILMACGNLSTDVIALPPGETKERDLSWLDNVSVYDLSPDGKTFIFDYFGEGSGVNYAAYLRKTDGSPAIRIGEGAGISLSNDGKWVASILHSPSQIVLLPTGPGEARYLEQYGIEEYSWVSWFPVGEKLFLTGREAGHRMRCYLQDTKGGPPHPITPEGVTGKFISPDGKFIIVTDGQNKTTLYEIEGGSTRPIPSLDIGDQVIRWSGDHNLIYVTRPRELPIKVFSLDLTTGRRKTLREIMPSDMSGLIKSPEILLTSDGKSYVYQLRRYLTTLYLVEGLK
jgi:eukaryotic-like serine/threonine-protein kinase